MLMTPYHMEFSMKPKPRSTDGTTRLSLCVAAGLLTAIWAAPGSAMYVHTYTGNPFGGSAMGLYNDTDSVTGSFTTDDDLGPNRALASVTALAGFTFSFTDGQQTFDNINCCDSASFLFEVGTDEFSTIIEWSVDLENSGVGDVIITENTSFGFVEGSIENPSSGAFNSNPGTWLSVGGPPAAGPPAAGPTYILEPTTLAVFGLGLAGLGFMRLRRTA